MDKKRINIPPVYFVIFSAVMIVICIIGMVIAKNSSFKDEFFYEEYRRCEATCTGKTSITVEDEEVYTIYISYTIKKNGYDTTYQTSLNETDPFFAGIDQGSVFDIYYHLDDPTVCRPTVLDPTHIEVIIVLGVIILLFIALAAHHIRVIIRNRHGYTPKFEAPDDIGYMGNAGAETGLDDKEIDYSGGNTHSNNPMDSFIDPFAVYTGYDDQQEQQQPESYFDPNAGAEYTQPYEPEQPYPSMSEDELNNPFASNVNYDPNNPYNAGTYDSPVSMFDPNSDYNSADIYGDSSFGAGQNGFPQ